MFGYFQMAWYRNLTGRFCGVVSRSIYELRRILTSLLHTEKKKKQKETIKSKMFALLLLGKFYNSSIEIIVD